MSQFAQHLNVIGDAFVESLCFKRSSYLLEILFPVGKVFLNLGNGALRALLGGHEQVCGVYPVVVECGQAHTCHAVNLLDAVDVVIPERDSQYVVAVCKAHLHGIALHAEIAA